MRVARDASRALPYPHFCDMHYRAKEKPPWAGKSLAGLMASVDSPGKSEKASMASGKSLYRRWNAGGVMSTNNPYDTNFETFIICKGPRDHYFRSNPPWIALHVVTKFRNLLVRLRDEALVIDYTLLQASRTPNLRRRGYLTADESAHERSFLAPSESHVAGRYSHSVEGALGGKAATSLMMKSRAYRRISKTRVNRAHEVRDRSAIRSSVMHFPFSNLKPHGRGSMSFREVLTYFMREVKCEVVRTWAEKEDGDIDATQYAELTLPVGVVGESDQPGLFNKELQDRLRASSEGDLVTNFYLGEGVQPIDPIEGLVWGGTRNKCLSRYGLGVLNRAKSVFDSKVLRGKRADTWTRQTSLGYQLKMSNTEWLDKKSKGK